MRFRTSWGLLVAVVFAVVPSACSTILTPVPAHRSCGFVTNGALRIVGLTVVDVVPHADGSNVSLRFEIVDQNGRPRNELKAGRIGNFRVCDDGREDASGEGLASARLEGNPAPVVMVLDTSSSLEHDRALGELKRLATQLLDRLGESGKFSVSMYQFASKVERVPSISAISGTSASGRWTSLYAAVKRAIREQPGAIVVVFTDGADNYSDDASHGANRVAEFEELELELKKSGVAIHSIGLGKVHEYKDESGLTSDEVLRRMSVNGSFRSAETVEELGPLFEQVADRIAATYFLDFLSQHRDGERTLVLAAYDGPASGQSQVKFQATTPPPRKFVAEEFIELDPVAGRPMRPISFRGDIEDAIDENGIWNFEVTVFADRQDLLPLMLSLGSDDIVGNRDDVWMLVNNAKADGGGYRIRGFCDTRRLRSGEFHVGVVFAESPSSTDYYGNTFRGTVSLMRYPR